MTKKDKRDEEQIAQDVTIEDLPVNEEKQDEVKGGATTIYNRPPFG